MSNAGFAIVISSFCFLVTDIDECSANNLNECSQKCLNSPGSYECDCNSGYALNKDGRACDGKETTKRNYQGGGEGGGEGGGWTGWWLVSNL